jgi:hypothetical protein
MDDLTGHSHGRIAQEPLHDRNCRLNRTITADQTLSPQGVATLRRQ